MDFKRLKYFLVLAEERHFGRAAKRLNIVQPALSIQIRAMEEELGGALFARTSRQVELTPAGELCLQRVRSLLAQADDLKELMLSSMRGELGKVRIGFSCTIAFTDFFAAHMKNFQDHYPGVELQMQEMPPVSQVKALLAGNIDVAYAVSLGWGKDARLLTREIARWPHVVAMRKDHPLAAKTQLTVEDLRSDPLIIYAEPEDLNLVASGATLLGKTQLSQLSQADSILTMLTLTAAGQGLAIMPSLIAHIHVVDVVYVPLRYTPPISSSFSMLRRAEEVDPVVLNFWNFAQPE